MNLSMNEGVYVLVSHESIMESWIQTTDAQDPNATRRSKLMLSILLYVLVIV